MLHIMGIDIGTTGCKANVYNETAALICCAYREYPMTRGSGQIDPCMVRDSVFSVIRECAQICPSIAAICTTSFGETVAAVDAQGTPLFPSTLYTDTSAARQLPLLVQGIGDMRIAEITGHMPHSMYTVNRLMELKQSDPDRYRKVECFLPYSAFIARCLGAEPYYERSQAARTMMFDVRSMCWSPELTACADISTDKLGRVVDAGEAVGRVDPSVASALGLTGQPLLIAGGQDQPCVALGMAAVHGGDVAYGQGTVECFTLVLDGYRMNRTMFANNLVCAPHVVPGKYLTYGVLFSGGAVVTDIRNKLYAQELARGEDPYPLMMDEMSERTTNVLFVPHLAGSGTPEMDTTDTGIISGLTLATHRGELVRAAIEGISFDIRRNIENMRRSGFEIGCIRCAGGGTRSAKAMQLRSDAVGLPLEAANSREAGTLGAYYIAARALGILSDLEQVPVPKTTVFRPSRDTSKQYIRWQKLLAAAASAR